MTDINKVASDFIIAYYRKVVYDQTDIVNFYSTKAEVLRNTFEENKAKIVGDVPPHLFLPKMEAGTEFSVTEFVSSPTNDGFTLFVKGNILFRGKNDVFEQNFTFEKNGESWFVIRDSLTINENKEPLKSSQELTVIKKFNNNNRKPKRDSRFDVYIPGK